MAEVARYLKQIKRIYEAGLRDESAYRQPLTTLIASTADGVTSAPVRTLAGSSSVDLVVLVNREPIGHILYERITTDLGPIKEGLRDEGDLPPGDLLLTNFIEFRHYRDGSLVRSARLAEASHLFKPSRRGAGQVNKLLQLFVSIRAEQPAKEPPRSVESAPDTASPNGDKDERKSAVEEFQFFDDLYSKEGDGLPRADASSEPTPPVDEGDAGSVARRGFFSRLFGRRRKPQEQASSPVEETEQPAPDDDDELHGTLLDLSLSMPPIPIPSAGPDEPSPPRKAAAPAQGEAPLTAEGEPIGEGEAPGSSPTRPGDDLPWWLKDEAEEAPGGNGTPADVAMAEDREQPPSDSSTVEVGAPGDEIPPDSPPARSIEAEPDIDQREATSLLSQSAHDSHERGEVNEAFEQYWQALLAYRELGDRHGEASTLASLGRIYAAMGEREYALSQFVEALPLLDDVEDPPLRGLILGYTGIIHHEMGIEEAAAAHLTDALPLVTGDDTLHGLFLGMLGETKYRLGNPEHAASLLEEALAYRSEPDALRARFLNALGAARYRLGAYRAASDALLDAVHIAQQSGDRDEEGRLWARLGAALHMTGDRDEADDAYRKALTLHRALGDSKREATALYNLAGACEARRQFDEAARLFEQAAALYEALDETALTTSARRGIERVRMRSAEAEPPGIQHP